LWKLKAVKTAVKDCTSTVEEHKRASISKCPDILGFNMGNKFVPFQYKFDEYGEYTIPDNRNVTIAGFKSTILSNLLASFLLDKQSCFFTSTLFHGLFHDNRIDF